MPADPTPVTDGLVAWFRSDMNIVSSENLVSVWGGVCECYPNAVSIGTTQPVLSDSSFGSYPGLTFDGTQSLQIQAGALAQDSFTIFILGRATGDRVAGGYGVSGQRLLLSQSGDGSNAWPSISAGQSSIGVYEYGPTNAARADYSGDTGDTEVLCPLVVRYENRQLSILLRSELVYQDTATPAYALWLAHYLGGTGDADSGFIGALAEILFYNRALSEFDRQAVESYLQTRYGCMPSSSESGESSESASSDSSDSSDSSSSESSNSSSSDSIESESSDSAAPEIAIYRDDQEFSEPVSVYAGEVLTLQVRVKGTTEAPSDIQWAISGTRLKDYDPEKAVDQVTELSEADLAGSEVQFHWVSGDAQTITVSGTVDGAPVTTSVQVTVMRPSVHIVTTGDGTTKEDTNGNPIDTGPFFKTWAFAQNLQLWKKVLIGAWIHFEAVHDYITAGNYAWVQIVNSSVNTQTLEDGTTKQWNLHGLDIEFPYPSKDNYTVDGPSSLALKPDRTHLDYMSDLTMYYMYKPALDNAKWVPLRAVYWNFRFKAHCVNTLLWEKDDADVSTNPQDFDAQISPAWDQVVPSDPPLE